MLSRTAKTVTKATPPLTSTPLFRHPDEKVTFGVSSKITLEATTRVTFGPVLVTFQVGPVLVTFQVKTCFGFWRKALLFGIHEKKQRHTN